MYRLGLLIAVFFITTVIGCGGGAGGGLPDVDAVAQGSGPALDMSSNDNVAKEARSMMEVISLSMMQASLESKAPVATKATDPADTRDLDLCKNGVYSKTYGPFTLKSNKGGELIYAASVNAKKIEGGNAELNVSETGEFKDFALVSNYGGNITVDTGLLIIGKVSETSLSNVTGYSKICSAIDEGKPLDNNLYMSIPYTRNTVDLGALTISGKFGAAVAYEVERNSNYTPGGQPIDDIKGKLQIKSGGKTAECELTLNKTSKMPSATCKVLE